MGFGDEAGSASTKLAAALKAEGRIGATSEQLAPKHSFFNILYSHPSFGACMPRLTASRCQRMQAMPAQQPVGNKFTPLPSRSLNQALAYALITAPLWGEVQQRRKVGEPVPPLPPPNSAKGELVKPADRRLARVPWGPRGALPLLDQTAIYPASPSMHPTPTPVLPSREFLASKLPYRMSTPESVKPWVRNPPHTSRSRQIYECLYGPEKPKSPKARGIL